MAKNTTSTTSAASETKKGGRTSLKKQGARGRNKSDAGPAPAERQGPEKEDEELENGDELDDIDSSEDVLPLVLDEEGAPPSSAALPILAPDAPGALAVFTHRPPERTRDSLQLYLREINRFPMLKPDEELELARRVRDQNDPDAAFRLVSSHLRLVVRVAMDFQRRWMQNVLDLIQEGNVGLVRAVSKFDPEKGIKFSYYATFWIKAYILKFIMDNWRLVKIGTTQTQRKLFYNLNKERQQLITQGYDPDAAMLAERLNVTEEQIVEMEQRMDSSDMSLDAPMNEEDAGGASRMDYLPALGPGIEETLGNREISHMVRERLATLAPTLNDKEQYILDHRLLSDEPVTLREIGDRFHITRERVRQIEARLLQKVRDHLVSNIKDFSRDWIE
ncbi:RNA polymerase factor sigma-32 [Desulfovibrio sp. OttesenSCG-928-A18]|nr:RNA polymerase factor sigma-32 [Desulfovibrio sp. OttesenSCG-928-A18]